jgi:kynureninase
VRAEEGPARQNKPPVIAASDPLLRRRAEFPILAECTYLISNSLGAMPARARDWLSRYADQWAHKGVTAWDEWLALVDRSAGLVARILGADARDVIMQPNVTTAQWILTSCVEFHPRRNKVVYSSLEFPTVHYVWQSQTRHGARVEIVPSSDGIRVDTDAMLAAIDEHTVAVPISHVLFRSSAIADVAPIIRRAHDVGALVFLDVYQSAGSLPLDVTALGADAVVGGSLKWLCGGPGAAFLWINPAAQERLRPALVGWFGHRQPFAFSMEVFEPADGAWGYVGGTVSPAALSAAQSGLEIIAELGVPAIRERSLLLTDYVIAKARERGLQVRTPLEPGWRGGHVSLDFPGSAQACQELLARGVLVDWRPEAGIRVAPHFYNTLDDIDRAFAELDAIRADQR